MTSKSDTSDLFSNLRKGRSLSDSFPSCNDMYAYTHPVYNDWLNSMQFPYISNVPIQNVPPQVNFAEQARAWNSMNLTHTQQKVNDLQKSQAQHYLQQNFHSLYSPALAKSDQENKGNLTPSEYGRKDLHAVPRAYTVGNPEAQFNFLGQAPPSVQHTSKNNHIIPPAPCGPVLADRDRSWEYPGSSINKKNTKVSPNRVLCRKDMQMTMDHCHSSRPIAANSDSTLFAAYDEGSPLNDLARKLEIEMVPTPPTSKSPDLPEAIEKAAIRHRQAASSHEAACTWRGILPHRKYDNPIYSNKVFLGGVPWDITSEDLQEAFSSFGDVKIEFPGSTKTPKSGRCISRPGATYCFGYVYVVFDCDKRVKAMLQMCKGQPLTAVNDCAEEDDCFYLQLSSKKMRSKDVQVIPWLLSDSNYVAGHQPYRKLDSETTIFVGALHGMLSAQGLAHVMQDLFGDVIYAGVDTDKHKYPIGSGRVTFGSHKSYMKAVNAAFVEIKTTKFVKKVQIDPYLEETPCSQCRSVVGPYFCRNQCCFKYYCSECWSRIHDSMDLCTGVHKPVMRNSKNFSYTTGGRSANNCSY